MSYRADKLMIDTQTHKITDAADDNTRRPKLASGKNEPERLSKMESRDSCINQVFSGKVKVRKAISPVPGPEHCGYLKNAPDSHLILKHEARTDQSHSESWIDRGIELLQWVYMLQIAKATQRPRQAWPAEEGKLRFIMGIFC